MRPGVSFGTALIAVLTLGVSVASGTLTTVQSSSLTPATKVPVTLSSTQGTIASPFTSATLTGIAVNPVTSVTVLTIVHGTSSWSVQLAVTARSGFIPIADSVVFTLAGPTSSAVTIGASTPASLPAVTSAVALGTSSDLTVTARGVCTNTCTITAELRFMPAAGAVPGFVLPISIGVT
jgi:hypothetical protein